MRCLALVFGLALVASVAHAAEWDTIRPGESTQDAVRAQLGQPTKVTSRKVDGYDSPQWLYEGAQSPRGVAKLTIDFGLLTPQGYKPQIVRVMELLPKPGVFTRQTITFGWGVPQGMKTEDGIESVFYQAGLIVRFDKDGWVVTSLVFTPPQTLPEESAPKSP